MFSRTTLAEPAINRKSIRMIGIGVLALSATVALAGCSMNMDTTNSSMMVGMDHSTMDSSDTGEFSATDVMFAQMMIPHHKQAVEMSDLALATSTNPDVLALAQQIRDAQAPEITLMTGWLTTAGAPMAMGHDMNAMGAGMDGMMTDDEMSALTSATGAAFDTLFLQGMIAHHEGAVQMAAMVTDTKNAEVKKLGDAIIAGQSAEITQMKAILTTLAT